MPAASLPTPASFAISPAAPTDSAQAPTSRPAWEPVTITDPRASAPNAVMESAHSTLAAPARRTTPHCVPVDSVT